MSTHHHYVVEVKSNEYTYIILDGEKYYTVEDAFNRISKLKSSYNRKEYRVVKVSTEYEVINVPDFPQYGSAYEAIVSKNNQLSQIIVDMQMALSKVHAISRRPIK